MTETLTRETEAQTHGITSWTLDRSHTLIEFSAKHMMFTTVKGHFTEFDGVVHINEQQPTESEVRVEIVANSLDTGTDQRDTHLRSADFLDVEHYPTITFQSRRVELPRDAHVKPGLSFTILGDLTIRGTTREVRLAATWQGEGVGPYGNRVSGFGAATKINRRDFGLTWNVALETGGWLVGDEIKIEIEAQLNPAQPAEQA